MINSAFIICSSFYLFFEIWENKFTDENSVHDKKKLLSLKCVINDTLIGSQGDKLLTSTHCLLQPYWKINFWGLKIFQKNSFIDSKTC